jgi:hypothetical protein
MFRFDSWSEVFPAGAEESRSPGCVAKFLDDRTEALSLVVAVPFNPYRKQVSRLNF